MLKIQVEALGLPTLSRLIGKKTEWQMAEGTVADLISQIVSRTGQQARKILLDQTGELDMTIQVMLNDEGFVPMDCVLRGIASSTYAQSAPRYKFFVRLVGRNKFSKIRCEIPPRTRAHQQKRCIYKSKTPFCVLR
jgi:hypothetical protein